jgi:uncharacterized membrane protein
MELIIFKSLGPLLVSLMALISFVSAKWSRADHFFAVTVGPKFRQTALGQKVQKRYRFLVFMTLGFALPLSLWVAFLNRPEFMVAAIFLQLAGSLLAFLYSHHQVRPHGVAVSTIREANLNRPSAMPASAGWQAGPFLVIAASALWLATHWAELPLRIPMRWDLEGHANRWLEKTPLNVVSALLVSVFACGFLALVGFGISTFSKRSRTSGAAGHAEAHYRRGSVLIVLSAEYLVALSTSMPIVWPTLGSSVSPLALVLAFLASIGALFIAIGVAMKRSQAPAEIREGAAPRGDGTPDQQWKLGLFYFDRSDPSLLIQKRFGFGYTVNVGHPWMPWLALTVFGCCAALATIPLFFKP